MKILVIGGTGFIGARVVKYLLNENNSVAVFHRGETQVDMSRVPQFIYGNRKKLAAFANDFKKFAPDVVLDMIPYTEEDAVALTNTFRGMTRRVVAISSMDVYAAYGRFLRNEDAEPVARPFSEDAPLRSTLYPYRAYAQDAEDLFYNYDKILVERVVINETKLFGTILRLPKVYGCGDKQHRMFEYLKRMDDGRLIILLEERKAHWRWTRGYVENVAAAIARAVTSEQEGHRIYNIGEADALTEAEWVKSIGDAAGWNGKVIAVPIEILPDHLVEGYDYGHNLAADTSRFRIELGYSEPFPREEALKRAVSWERNNPPTNINAGKFDYSAEDAALERHHARKML